MREKRIFRAAMSLLAVAVLLVSSGCATLRHPVPKDLVLKAEIRGMSDVRAIIGETGTSMQENLLESIKQERPEDYPTGADGIKVYPTLALSGGGANGAYGAGLLKGWSREGSRPLFKIITAVSTGAIIGPLVFLGKDYDDEMEDYYTTLSTKDIMKSKGIFGALFGDSFTSNAPLAKQIALRMTDDLLAKVAVQHRRGRRLFVGTANIDAQRFVVWDMGAIACRGDRELFCKVILASAAIPVVFPPSKFQVEADGVSYDELHVDGGTLTQIFTTYKLFEGMEGAIKALGIDLKKIRARVYVIRNGYMSPQYQDVKDSLAPLATRSFNTIIDAQGVGDIYRIYAFMKDRGNDYNLAYIPSDYKDESKEMFDTVAMRKLFDRGYNDAVRGYKWHKAPPGLANVEAAAKELE